MLETVKERRNDLAHGTLFLLNVKETMLILRRSLPILADGAVFSCHCAVLP